jgi:LDH2 family malate/lactate/ureidoglycolate dehydrogenase
MSDDLVNYYPRETLIAFTQTYLKALGATDEEAIITADGIVTAAGRWHPGKGQGLEKLFRLTVQCSNGGINVGAEFEILKETPAVALVDAHKGLGYVVGVKAMKLAVEKAKTVGTGSVLVRHSNHFGQAGYHAEIAAKAGMIGISMTNAGAEMAPWGGKTAVLATNPWGLAIPRAKGNPILLDMALTMSGQGMVKWAYREGVSIPDNWVLTAEGRRSTDPAEFIAADSETFAGTQLPIGEFKGYGLSLFTDVITGVLSGALFGTAVFTDITNFDVGHFLMALNPNTFMLFDDFQSRLEQLITEIKSAEPIKPGDEIYLPGEPEYRREQKTVETGIPINVKTVEKLRDISKAQGVVCPL